MITIQRFLLFLRFAALDQPNILYFGILEVSVTRICHNPSVRRKKLDPNLYADCHLIERQTCDVTVVADKPLCASMPSMSALDCECNGDVSTVIRLRRQLRGVSVGHVREMLQVWTESARQRSIRF